jgi:hypothetical protein
MKNSRLRPLVLAAFAFAVIGCDQGRENPPDVAAVRVMNVAPGYALMKFAREQTDPVDVQFRNGIVVGPYDEDTYDFKVYVRDVATGGSILKKEFAKQIASGTLYTFVLAQSGTGIQELLLESVPPAPTATDLQVVAAHAGEQLPAMDVFLERPGTDIAGAVPWGNLSFLGTLPARNVATGDYEVTLTAAGDRSNVLYKSPTITLTAATSVAFVITPEGESSVSPMSVTVTEASFGALSNGNSSAAVRVLNAAADAAPRDVAFNGQFNPPLFAAVPFGAATAHVPIAPGADIPINVTPPGNPGVLELDQKNTFTASFKYTVMFSGEAGALTRAFALDDARRLLDEASIVFYNAASQFTGGLDLVFLQPGDDPTLVGSAALTLGAGAISGSLNAQPGTYNVYLRQAATSTVVAGPIPVTMAASGIYGFLATNGPDSVTATVTLLHDFQ